MLVPLLFQLQRTNQTSFVGCIFLSRCIQTHLHDIKPSHVLAFPLCFGAAPICLGCATVHSIFCVIFPWPFRSFFLLIWFLPHVLKLVIASASPFVHPLFVLRRQPCMARSMCLPGPTAASVVPVEVPWCGVERSQWVGRRSRISRCCSHTDVCTKVSPNCLPVYPQPVHNVRHNWTRCIFSRCPNSYTHVTFIRFNNPSRLLTLLLRTRGAMSDVSA